MELRLTGDDLVMVFLFSLLPVLYKMFKMPILNPEIIRNKYRIILKEEGRRSSLYLALGVAVSFALSLIGSDFYHAIDFIRKVLPFLLYISFISSYSSYVKKHNL
jgi:hypothetical protein